MVMDISRYMEENGEKFWGKPPRVDKRQEEENIDLILEIKKDKGIYHPKLIDMDAYNSTLEDNIYQEIDKKIKFY